MPFWMQQLEVTERVLQARGLFNKEDADMMTVADN